MFDVKQAIADRYKNNKPELAPIERRTLTVKETATYLGLSADMLYKLVREKKIPNVKIGSRIMFKIESIEQWLADLERESCNY
ncbi:helix-turn-helix domain-containing protein [Lentibacillus sp. L22]|uniref:helix-turn-helix domain-containing protein n=1 Tax=Lentibacillus sp. L22 TaxID=3163028 RepID=UPI0034665060